MRIRITAEWGNTISGGTFRQFMLERAPSEVTTDKYAAVQVAVEGHALMDEVAKLFGDPTEQPPRAYLGQWVKLRKGQRVVDADGNTVVEPH